MGTCCRNTKKNVWVKSPFRTAFFILVQHFLRKGAENGCPPSPRDSGWQSSYLFVFPSSLPPFSIFFPPNLSYSTTTFPCSTPPLPLPCHYLGSRLLLHIFGLNSLFFFNNNQNLKFCIFIFHYNHDVNLGCKTARRGTAAPLPYLRSAHRGRASRNQYARWSLPLRQTPLLVSLRPPHYIHLNHVEPLQSRFSRTVLPTRHQHLARNLAIATYPVQGFVYHGAGL